MKRVALLVGCIFGFSKNDGDGTDAPEERIAGTFVSLPSRMKLAKPLLKELLVNLDLLAHLDGDENEVGSRR